MSFVCYYGNMRERTVYIAGKLNAGEDSIASFADELELRNHTVLEKWWTKPELPTPYLENAETSAEAASAMIAAAYESDVFVLFPGNTILGAAVEFGAAIASTRDNPDKLVIVNDPESTRQSVFYAHPAVIAANGLVAIRKMDWFGEVPS